MASLRSMVPTPVWHRVMINSVMPTAKLNFVYATAPTDVEAATIAQLLLAQYQLNSTIGGAAIRGIVGGNRVARAKS